MNFISYSYKKFVLFFVLIIVFFACTKITDTTIGAGLLPPVDGVNTRDTVLAIQTKNVGIDTAYVGVSDNHVLGYMNDQSFGTTNASINFQVSSPTYPLTFEVSEDSISVDSVVLCLQNEGIWGDSMQPSALRVYQMDNETLFTSDSLYRSNKIFEKGNEITESNQPKTFFPYLINDPDTIKQFKEIADNTLRIRLNKSFGEQLFNQTTSNPTVYTNDSTFHNYLRGLMVVPEQTGSSLLQVSLTDTSTRLTVYYHYLKTTGGDSASSRRFSVNSSSSASSNTILRNYNGAPIANYLPPNNINQSDLVFIQTSPGTYARLKLQGLNTFPNVVVHRAEILMTEVPDGSQLENYLPPPKLFVSAYSQDSMVRFAVPNDVVTSTSGITNLTAFGVNPLSKNNGNTYYYSFDISRYVQSIVTKKDSVHDLILWAPYNYYLRPIETYPAGTAVYVYPIASPALNKVGTGRIVLGGGNNANDSMKLHIVYSLIK